MTRIKTGVVGYGFSGRIFQCPFIDAHDGFELSAVVQRHSSDAKDDYPNITIYSSIEDLLNDDSIELVVVSTPSFLHFEQAKMALAAGKHVLVEKPYTATYEQALELNRLAEQAGKVITVYQNRRYDGDYLTIKKMLDDGVKIYEYDAVWDRYVPEIRDRWKEAGLEASDLKYDLGTHFLDQAISLFGEPQVFQGIVNKLREDTKIVDYFSMTLKYPGTVVRLKSCLVAVKPDLRYKLQTSQGTYHFHEMGEQEHQLLAGLKPNDTGYGDNAMYDYYDHEGNVKQEQVVKGTYMDYFTKLYEAIREGGEPPVKPAEAAMLIKYLERVEEM